MLGSVPETPAWLMFKKRDRHSVLVRVVVRGGVLQGDFADTPRLSTLRFSILDKNFLDVLVLAVLPPVHLHAGEGQSCSAVCQVSLISY